MEYPSKPEKYFDIIITVLFSLFLLSLTNSIFVNQLGYFGALFIILVKFLITKKNPFSKSGLEYPFLFFIVAMIFSTLFSVDTPSSFENLLKRLLLIPVLYTTLSFCSDEKRIKYTVNFFLVFAVISIVIYVIFAVEHFLSNLYGIQQSGPGLFHYPITTSEIISFVVVIFFAFLLNEKGSWKKRLFYLSLFALSSVALIATYKRTGWIGAFAGIIYIIILNRKYLYLGFLLVLIILAFILDTQTSNIILVDINKPGSENRILPTEGRAQSILPIDRSQNKFLLSDYQNGLIPYNDLYPKGKIYFPSPVNDVIYVNDSLFLTYLSDTRFVLCKTVSGLTSGDIGQTIIVREFVSPGYTVDYKYFNNSLYILDKDSGLTVFENISGNTVTQRNPQSDKFLQFFVDSSRIILLSPGEFIEIRSINGISAKIKTQADFIFYNDGILFLSGSSGLRSYTIKDNSLIPIDSSNRISNTRFASVNNSFLFFADPAGKVSIVERNNEGFLKITHSFETGTPVNSIASNDSYVFLTSQKQSRLRSIFDPYNTSNATRIQLWTAGLKILADHPLFGVGDIDLAKLYIEYKNYYDKEIQGHLHNNFFHILAIFGIIGFLSFLYLFCKIILINYRIYRLQDNPGFFSSLSLGINGAFIAFLFSGLTEWNFGDHEIITMVWFLIGLNIAILNISKPAMSDKN
ncbi:MAG: O-antigen ligase family protein [Ignavibacteriaceae bacterium]